MDPLIFLRSVPEILREPVIRWWERAQSDVALRAAYLSLPAARRDELARVVAASEFAASAMIQDPGALAWTVEHWTPVAASAANADCERLAASAATAADAQQLLRRWRRREMVRIAWRDIVAAASVRETLRDVSALADGCIRAASRAARAHLAVTFGIPRTVSGAEAELIVLGMGKLGGRELNFSSDVDLVFLFEGAGETDGPRSVDNQDYFTRLGRELIRLLDARTEDGFAFRVDMRLRPFGECRAFGREPCLARGLSAPARTGLGAVRLDQGSRHRGRRCLRGGKPRIRPAVRVSALSGFRRVRIASRDEGA